MQIASFRSISLNNYPNQMSSCLWTAGCNLRCQYCHNPQLINLQSALMNEEKIKEKLLKAKKMVKAICISGGEPLLQKDIESFIRYLKFKEFKIKLDTNGTLPGRLKSILEKGYIDYVAMDIKGPAERYSLITQKNIDINLIKHSIDFIRAAEINYEFRTTVVKPLLNEEDIYKIGSLVAGPGKLYLQPFNNKNILNVDLLKTYKLFSIESLNKISEELTSNYIESLIR